nr:unnamed protein product [Naegleria fowleri]
MTKATYQTATMVASTSPLRLNMNNSNTANHNSTSSFSTPIHAVRCQDTHSPDNSSMNSRRNSTTSSSTNGTNTCKSTVSSKSSNSLSSTSTGIEKQSKRKTNSKLKEFTTVFDIKKTSVSFVSRNGDEPKKTRRAQASITKEEILRVLHLSQTQACNQIGCSLSTLKRRFYELKDDMGLQRWPQFYEEIKDLPIFPQVYPMCLEFILNREDEDPITTSSMQQQQFSSSSSSCSASLNKMNRKVATSPSTNTSSSSSSSPVQ